MGKDGRAGKTAMERSPSDPGMATAMERATTQATTAATSKQKKQKPKKRRAKSDTGVGAKETGLEAQPWYFGAIPLTVICELDKLKKAGDFLVRSNLGPDGRVALVLSIAAGTTNKEILHFPIDRDPAGYRLGQSEDEIADSVYGLIKFYLTEKKPVRRNTEIFLKKAVLRPEWILPAFCVKEKPQRIPLGSGQVFACRLKAGGKVPEKGMVKRSKAVPSEEEWLSAINEVRVLSELHHPNIVTCLGASVEQFPVGMVLELMEGGSLESHLAKNRASLPVTTKFRFCADVALALEECEKRAVMHRDVRAANCLVGVAPRLVVKLAEFGQSKRGATLTVGSWDPGQTPVRWAAPESLGAGEFSPKSDVFGLGVLAWEVFHEEGPWAGVADDEVQRLVSAEKRLEWNPKAPGKARDAAKSAWAQDPAARPSASTLANTFINLSTPK